MRVRGNERMTNKTDVLIIGGGPAGSTAAITLAAKGYRVTLLEKSRHPRFHIGESLLPANLRLFDRLGVAEEMKAIGMEKWAAEFVSPWHQNRSSFFQFGDAWDKSMPYAYQVRRSQFDEILFRRAASREGVEAIEGCRVKEVDLDKGTDHPVLVEAEHEDGRGQAWEARYLIDASGRDTFLGNRLRIKQRDRMHNSAAMFGHFKGVARSPDLKVAGNITLYWIEHGWIWFIPLRDGITSIGTVVWPYYTKTRKKPVREFYLDTLALCPPLMERIKGAELVTDVEATGNYSYKCARSHGKNHIMIGDAFAFVDPMFSSGVLLAMTTGEKGAETVDLCLREPARARAQLRHFERVARHGPREYSWFIRRATQPIVRDLFMEPANHLRMKEAVLSVLAGDIYGRTPMWLSLRCFKALYYLILLAHPLRALEIFRRRQVNIAPAQSEA
jgi:flavin-dependent dehydrogenase